MLSVDVLIPTRNRRESLIMALSGVAAQTRTDLRVVVADQSETPVSESPVVESLLRMIEVRGGVTEYHHRPPVHGVAEQRDFLLGRGRADAVLFLDDDVFMESWVVERLAETLEEEQCGFVGAFGAGPSYRDDVRPSQHIVERWDGPVRPEAVEPDSPEWERWQLHRAANTLHAAQELPPGVCVRYKVAWLGACVLYDRAKLNAIGGFGFWRRLPRRHSGEDVVVQNLLMRRWGGCGILPSGTYFSEVPTTIHDEQGQVEGHALDLLPELIGRLGFSARAGSEVEHAADG